jgi:N-glycosidase YbiA
MFPTFDKAYNDIITSPEYNYCINYSKNCAKLSNVKKPPRIITERLIEFYNREKNGNNDKFGRLLTNCVNVLIKIDDVVYPSTEHYFQMAKFIVLEDDINVINWCNKIKIEPSEQIKINDNYRNIMLKLNPVTVATAGRNRNFPIRADWENIKYQIMFTALMAKFTQNKDCADVLLSTGNRVLIERSPNDSCWAINDKGIGNNMLGIMLMMVREKINK